MGSSNMAARHLGTLCHSAPSSSLNCPHLPPHTHTHTAPTGETQSTCSAIWRHLPGATSILRAATSEGGASDG